MRGIELRREAWDEVFKDEDKFALLLPVLASVHEDDPDPELRSWETPPSGETRKNVLAGLSVGTQWLYDYFRECYERRLQEAAPTSAGRAASRRKVGRNEPCFCGSGKKYKRCCGSSIVQ